ncbi:MAG: DNA polymerase III subunit gamma/tau [Tepidanaerobacteraceae bacterium]|jgi:DNA polymerase-3 subunit gamma/tau|nr:DNA polymerase III subunit gamma/tau [Tepidanaerobacteraceae bacterium]
MSYIALYRKYRPRDFDGIVGQDAIVTTLKNQIKTGRIGHAYLFCGMRGTGKTSTARVFAKALNCERGPTVNPCNQCAPCRAINNGSMMDVIEMDAASNRGIDDIRELREKVNFPPSEGKYKVYIIDEVHMLTTEAFNALLKTLEEPPRHVVFILATTEPNKLPATILSRCMRFDFSRVSAGELVRRMKEIAEEMGIEAEERALAQLARSSQGSVRDALSLMDKALAFGGKKILYDDVLNLLGAVNREVLFEISRAVLKKDGGALLSIVDGIATRGRDLFRFSDDLMEHFRDILFASVGADRRLIDVADEEYLEIQRLAESYSREKLLSIIEILKDAANDMKWSSQPRIVLEAAVLKLILPELWEQNHGYISRIQDLEQQMAALQEQVAKIATSPVKEDPAASGATGAASFMGQPQPPEMGATAGYPKGEISDAGSGFSPDSKQAVENRRCGAEAPAEREKNNRDEETFRQLVQAWPEIIEELGKKRKKSLQTFIQTADVRPARLEKGWLYLFGDDVYKEIILSDKHIIEETVKNVTGIDISIKGFEQQKNDESEKKNF